MLVLSRKLGEKIAIDGEIELEVLALSGNRVRLGIVAPDDCRIMRAERLAPADGRHDARPPSLPGNKAPLRHQAGKAHIPTAKSGSLPVRG